MDKQYSRIVRLGLAALLTISSFCTWADTLVFQSGKEREGKVVSESPTHIQFEDPLTGIATFEKSTIKEVRRTNPLPGQAAANTEVAAIQQKVVADRTAGRFAEAFGAISTAAEKNPQLAPSLSAEFTKTFYDLFGRAQKKVANNELEGARADYTVLYKSLTNNQAQVLCGSAEAFGKMAQAVRTEWAAVDVKLAQAITQPSQLPQAQELLNEAVFADPTNHANRLELANIALKNRRYDVAFQNYEALTKDQTVSADISRKAHDGLSRVESESGGQYKIARANPTPGATRTIGPAVTITPVPVVATPQAAPDSVVSSPTPPPGPAWKQIWWKFQNSGAIDTVKDLPSTIANGDLLGYIIGIPLIIILFWVFPYYFLVFLANRGDLHAAEARLLAKKIGFIALLPWFLKKAKTKPPKNRCPFCNKGIDNIDSYADLNFYTCPHCRENITPIYDLKDYIDHLVKQLEHEQRRGKGAPDSTLEKDAMLKLVRGVLTLAVRKRASDVHAETELEGLKVRARIDGMMYELMNLPRAINNAFISAVKVMANLDITERRIPQDGTIAMWIDKADVDLRVNTSPSAMGEKVTIRIQNQKMVMVDATRLGLEGASLEKFERAIRKAHGLVIVTGPSGSGKSTTLYVALNELNSGEKNIVTIEDPIEYQLKGLSQMQVNTAANFTFATGLRSILRQDPDVIMVGEIRDHETADIAIEAAMTGHLVFTTLHTIDAPSAFNRLADLGVETRRMASAVICVIAMRLIRTICPECKKPYKPKKTDLEQLGLGTTAKDITFVHGAGCENCMNTGYYGRIGIFEFLVPDDSMREILESNASVSVIRDLAKRAGYKTLREDGINRVMQGLTTVEEVLRVTT